MAAAISKQTGCAYLHETLSRADLLMFPFGEDGKVAQEASSLHSEQWLVIPGVCMAGEGECEVFRLPAATQTPVTLINSLLTMLDLGEIVSLVSHCPLHLG